MSAAVRGKGVHRRLSLGPALLVGILALSGCPSSGPDASPTRTDQPSATRDAGPSAAVTAAPPTGRAAVAAAVAVGLSQDGDRRWTPLGLGVRRADAVVLVGDPPSGSVARLVTLSAQGRRTGSTAVPTVAPAWNVHLLPDATAVVTGRLAEQDALGFAVVDATTGATRTVAAAPLDPDTSRVSGDSVMSADGRTVWLYSGALVDGRFRYRLSGHELATGRVVASRDLLPELRGIHVPDMELDFVGLGSGPGGVVLAVNVFPPGPGGFWSPTLLAYDGALGSPSGPVPLAPPGSRATALAMAMAPDGTAVVLVRGPPADRLVALPPGASTPESRLEVPASGFASGLLVDSSGRAVLPGPAGVRRVDLATGETVDIDLGCPGGVRVRRLAGSPTSGLWVLGDCFRDGSLRSMVWGIR